MNILVTGASGLIGTALVSSLASSGPRGDTPGARATDIRGEERPLGPSGGNHRCECRRGCGRGRAFGRERTSPSAGHRPRRSTSATAASKAHRSCVRHSPACHPPQGFGVCLGHRILWGPRRSHPHRRQPSGAGLSGRGLPCLGGGDRASATARPARRPIALGSGAECGRGALAKMLPPFRLGLGGMLGSGRQYMSWIALMTSLVPFSMRSSLIPCKAQRTRWPPSRHQSGIHQDAGESPRTAHGHSAASIRRASHVWGDGRRAITGECPCTAHQTPGLGVPVPVPELEEALQHLLAR